VSNCCWQRLAEFASKGCSCCNLWYLSYKIAERYSLYKVTKDKREKIKENIILLTYGVAGSLLIIYLFTDNFNTSVLNNIYLLLLLTHVSSSN